MAFLKNSLKENFKMQNIDLLSQAAANGNLERVKKLISRGFDPNVADSNGYCSISY